MRRLMFMLGFAGLVVGLGITALAQVQAPQLSGVIIGTGCTGGNSIWPARGSAVLQCNGSTYQPANPYVTPEMYGAVCDGSNNDHDALQAWMNSGRALLLTSRCAFTQPITVNLAASSAPRGLSVTGTGVNNAQLIANSTTATITVNVGAYANPIGAGAQVVMKDFGVIANVPNIGDTTNNYAVRLFGDNTATGSNVPNFIFSNMMIAPSNTSNYFNGGLYLQDIRNGTVSDCVIFGRYGGVPNGSGIAFVSTAVNSSPVDLHVRDCSGMAWWSRCLDVRSAAGSDAQGVYVTSSTFLACQNGISFIGQVGGGGLTASALLVAQGNHFNHGDVGILAQNVFPVMITNNYFLLANYGGISTAFGVFAEMTTAQSMFGQINGNTFYMAGAPQTTRIGVRSQGPAGASIANTITNAMCISSTPVCTSGS